MTPKLAVPLLLALGLAISPWLAAPAYADTINLYCPSTIPVDSTLDLYVQIDTIASSAKTWTANVRGGPLLTGTARVSDDEVDWTPIVNAAADRVGFMLDRSKNVLKSIKFDGTGDVYNCKAAPGVKAPS